MDCLGLQQLSSEINLTFVKLMAVHHWIEGREVQRLWPPYVLIQSRDILDIFERPASGTSWLMSSLIW